MACIQFDVNSKEVQDLMNVGLSKKKLIEQLSIFYNKHQRLPHRDEIYGADSSASLKKTLHINGDNICQSKNVLEYTNTNNLQEAVQKLNNIYRDLNIHITDLGDVCIFNVQNRPTEDVQNLEEYNVTKSGSEDIFSYIIDDVLVDYGINVHGITSEELNDSNFDVLNNKTKQINGFIFNNEVYLNLDYATSTTKLHELMHLILGSMRQQDPNLYYSLVDTIEKLPQYSYLAQQYSDRTRSDINEEIFITEMAKHLTNRDSAFNNLDSETEYNISYNIKRVLDTILDGEISAKVFEINDVLDMSLIDLAKILHSKRFKEHFVGKLEDSEISRLVNNTKSDLFKKGDLIEIC